MNIIFFADAGDDTPRYIFSGHLCFFSQEGNVTPLTPTHIYRKHISTRFLIKIIFFHFPTKEKISYFLEKRNTVFPDITKKIMFRREFFWKDHLFRTFEGNIIFPKNPERKKKKLNS